MSQRIYFQQYIEDNGTPILSYQIGNNKQTVLLETNDMVKSDLERKISDILDDVLMRYGSNVDSPLQVIVSHTGPMATELVRWENLLSSDSRPFSCRPDVMLAHSVQSTAHHPNINVIRAVPKLLVVACSPEGLPPLNCQDELNLIRGALREIDRDGSLLIKYEEITTETDLHNSLSDFKPDIVHFVGHTIQSKGQRLLALSKTRYGGKSIGLPMDSLQVMLLNAHVSLTILNACHTELIAQYLAGSGISSVGMKDLIQDRAARVFTEGFYFSLTRGQTLGAAINEGRTRMYVSDNETAYWSYPILVVADNNIAGFKVDIEPIPISEIRIDCRSPQFATVFVNNEKRGITPLTVRERLGYPVQLRLEHDRFNSYEITYTPVKRKEQVNIALDPRLGGIRIQINPRVSGTTVICHSIERPEVTFKAVTDGLGTVHFADMPVGKYEIDAFLRLDQTHPIQIDESTATADPIDFSLPIEVSIIDNIARLSLRVRNIFRNPFTLAATILLISLIFVALFLSSFSVRSDNSSEGMILINGQDNYPVLGVSLNTENTPSIGSESQNAYELRISFGNLIINELRSANLLYQAGRSWGEKPRLYMLRRPLFVDKNEVTVADYKEFLDKVNGLAETGGVETVPHHPLDNVNLDIPNDFIPENWDKQQQCASCPVVNIDYFDAWSYATANGKRLPTREEWEIVARGKEGRMFPWGNEYEPWRFNGYSSHNAGPVLVGQYIEGRTENGVFDLAGNVNEWVTVQESSASVTAGAIGGSFLANSPIHILPYGYFVKDKGLNDSATGFRCVADMQVDYERMVELSPGDYPIGGLRNFYFDIIRDLEEVVPATQLSRLLGDTPATVEIKPFYIDKYEVSVGEYAAFLDATRLHPEIHAVLWAGTPFETVTPEYQPLNWEDQVRNSFDLPVSGVSWYMATSYARWKGKRLPTLYEFEYLMGGQNRNLFPTGNTWNQATLVQNERTKSQRVNTTEVGSRSLVSVNDTSFQNSPDGLYHLFGNLSEWVDDPRYMSGTTGFVKGGSFDQYGYLTTFRFYKEQIDKNTTRENIGFRCARDAE